MWPEEKVFYGFIGVLFLLLVWAIWASIQNSIFIDENCTKTEKFKVSVTYIQSGNVMIPMESTQYMYNCNDGENRWK